MADTAIAVREWLRPHEGRMLELLSDIVELDTPSGDLRLLTAAVDELERWFAEIGVVERLMTLPGSAPHLRVDVGGGEPSSPLVLCHYDTVWPAGTAAEWPFEVDGAHATGPGVLDMKASLVAALFALRALAALDRLPRRGVTLLVTADEETGNLTSRELIADLARDACAALVLEPPLGDGRLKTERKGHANVDVRVVGRFAHAGVEPHRGVNAALEAAHIALAVESLRDELAGTQVNVGVIQAGERANVVAGEARLALEVRADSRAELERVTDAISAFRPRIEGARIEVDVDLDRPPMPRVAETDALLGLARVAGDALRIPIAEGATGGGSEGNFTQSVGTPTLDGLGVQGAGAHSPGERILISSFYERTALLSALLVGLGRS